MLPLARSFLHYFSCKYNRDVSFAPDVEQMFLNYKWPGNVRELENLVLGCVVTSKKGVIERSDLPASVTAAVAEMPPASQQKVLDFQGKTLKEVLDEVERQVILDGMKRLGNISELARELKVDRTTVFRKLKRYGK